MTSTPCACVSPDAHECWAGRYGIDPSDIALIEVDGGPCDCPCHDKPEEEE